MLNKASDGQFGTQWAYKLEDGHSIEEALAPMFFSNVRDNMLVGDIINLVLMKENCIVKYAEVIVVKKTAYDIMVKMTHEREFEFDTSEKKVNKNVEPIEEFIKGDGTVVWNPGRRRFDVVVDGNVVAWSADKQMAQSIARGDAPINRKAA